ncbi:hypothetical protein ACVIU4_004263 [Bradyrhizobium barranii subsp. barranii]
MGWEHLQPLSKYAMYAQNEQVHVAAWPSFSLYDPFAPALGDIGLFENEAYAGIIDTLTMIAATSQRMFVAQRILVGPVAELVDHGLRDRRAWREHEAGALHRIDARGGIVDLGDHDRAAGIDLRFVERIAQQARPSCGMPARITSAPRIPSCSATAQPRR